MNNKLALIAFALSLSACGGGGGGGSSDPSTAKVSFSIADAPVDDALQVVVTIDKVILRRDGAADVVVDRFTIPGMTPAVTNADTFQIDLLDYRNGNRLLIVDDAVVPAGSYSQLILEVIDTGTDYSYVEELDHDIKPIKQPSSQLKLGGFTASANGVYAYTLDFDLRKAMTYNPGPDRYILKPRGVRMVDNALAVSLSGAVDSALFTPNTIPKCATKADATVGNVVYLYQGHDLAALGDMYDPEIDTAPAGTANPFAAVNVYADGINSWRYNFGFLPAGNYTLAFSCNASGDLAETYEGNDADTATTPVVIPLPSDQAIELNLTGGQNATCNLPITAGACAPSAP